MHSNTNFSAPDPHLAKRPASLLAIAMDASNTLLATNKRPLLLPIPAAIFYTKRCLDNNLPSLFSLTLSPFFSFPLTNCPQLRLFVIAQTNTIASYIPSYLIYRSTPPSTQLSYFHHFHFICIFVTLQSLWNLQLLILACLLPHTPTKLPNSF